MNKLMMATWQSPCKDVAILIDDRIILGLIYATKADDSEDLLWWTFTPTEKNSGAYYSAVMAKAQVELWAGVSSPNWKVAVGNDCSYEFGTENVFVAQGEYSS